MQGAGNNNLLNKCCCDRWIVISQKKKNIQIFSLNVICSTKSNCRLKCNIFEGIGKGPTTEEGYVIKRIFLVTVCLWIFPRGGNTPIIKQTFIEYSSINAKTQNYPRWLNRQKAVLGKRCTHTMELRTNGTGNNLDASPNKSSKWKKRYFKMARTTCYISYEI